jgi:hypothetical protein
MNQKKIQTHQHRLTFTINLLPQIYTALAKHSAAAVKNVFISVLSTPNL